MLVVVVEAAFADSHQFRVAPAGQCEHRLDVLAGVMGVQSDGGVDVDGALDVRDLERLGRGRGVGADHDDAVDAALEGARQSVEQLRRRLLVTEELLLEVTVRVGPVTHSSLFIRGKSGSPFVIVASLRY